MLLQPLAAKHARGSKRGVKAVEPERPVEGEPPGAEDYRMKEGDIKHDVCIARTYGPKDSDKRFSKTIHHEQQCGKPLFPGGDHDLCEKCLTKFTENTKTWKGRLTEEPLDSCHMMNTLWFTDNKVTWRGWVPEKKSKSKTGTGPGTDAASVVSGHTYDTGVGERDDEGEEPVFPEAEVIAAIRLDLEPVADLSAELKSKDVVKRVCKNVEAHRGGSLEAFKDEIRALVKTVRDTMIAERAAAAASAASAASATTKTHSGKPKTVKPAK